MPPGNFIDPKRFGRTPRFGVSQDAAADGKRYPAPDPTARNSGAVPHAGVRLLHFHDAPAAHAD
jgi:hypothetical protein